MKCELTSVGRTALAFAIGLGNILAARADAPRTRFECREITGHDWSRTLVTYAAAKPGGDVRLVDEAGMEVPCQWSRSGTRLSFYAELKAGGAYQYELQPGKPAAAAAAPSATTDKGLLTLDNGVVAIRLPAGTQRFPKPLALCRDHAQAAAISDLAKEGLAPGPIAGIRLADGRWVGGSYFSFEPIESVRQRQGTLKNVPADAWDRAVAHAPGITKYESEITEQGPLFVEARIRFTFTNGGHYQLTARLLTGEPGVQLDEVMDLKSTCSPDDPLYVNLVLNDGHRPDGWRPDCVYGYAPRSDKYPALDAAVHAQAIATKTPDLRTASIPIVYDANEHIISEVTVLYPWGPYLHYAGLVDTAQLAKDKAAPFVGIVPRHGGTWRGAAFVFPPKTPQLHQQLLSHANGDVTMRWTIRNQPHVQNLLHTGEYDPEFGLTGMRRLWSLVGGPFQYHDALYARRVNDGFVNLDNYKDWTLAWSDDTRAALQTTVDPKSRNTALDQFRRGFDGNDDRGMKWWSHFRQAEGMAWAVEMRKTLADPAVPAEQKGLLRAQIAAFCHLMAEPDFNTRASASHQGNPNMPVNRFYALPFAAVLIPDHPLATRWLDVTRAYVQYELGLNLTPGTGYSELMTYYGAAAPTYVHAALVCQETGRIDDATRRLALGPVEFLLPFLTPPDARFGFRIVPGFGHEGVLRFNVWLPAAALVKAVDPERANLYAWAWKQQGQPDERQHCNGFALLSAAEGARAAAVRPETIRAALKSAWIPGIGVALHSHPGDPQETYLGYRQGYFSSHSDANQGDFVLYAKGAPLTVLSSFAYGISQKKSYRDAFNEFGWHSVVRTGAQNNNAGWPGGGPISGVHRHFFSESIDYLRGVGDTSNARVTGNDIARDLTAPDAQRWTRQIMFLKGRAPTSPNYFIFRDSFRSLHDDASKLTPTWWYQRTLGGKELVQPNERGFAYTSPYGPKLAVHFLQPERVAIESRTVNEIGSVGGGGLGGFITNNMAEALTITAAGPVPAGQDVLVAIYPRAADEAVAKFERLGEGVARITTAEGVDYVFLNPAGLTFSQDGIAFTGVAGALRILADEVHLVVGEGAGTVTYKGCTLRAGQPATRVVPLADLASGRTIDVPADPVTIQFALDERAGAITVVQPGVRKQQQAGGVAWQFDSAEPLRFAAEGVAFEGRRGGIFQDTAAGTVRLVMLDGTRIACGEAMAEVADGPYDLTYHRDKVVGVAEGPARLLYLSKPAGLAGMPCLTIDGASYAPGGYSGNDAPYCRHLNAEDAIIPLLGGRRIFTLEALKQPPVFRSWQYW